MADSDARAAAAAARRAKILARQKDRLSAITGTYAEPAGEHAPTVVQRSRLNESHELEDAVHHGEGAERQQEQQQRQQQHMPQLAHLSANMPSTDDATAREMAALLAAVGDSLQRAQTVSASAAAQHAPPVAQPAGTSGQAATALLAQSGAPLLAPAPQPLLAALVQLGPALALAVRQTAAARMLTAAVLAYALLVLGWVPPAPPALLLLAMSISLLAAATLVLTSTPSGRRALAEELRTAAAARDGAALPWRLRSFDAVALVPGLRPLLDAAGGYSTAARALSGDFSAYVAALGLLLVAARAGLLPLASGHA